VESHLTFNDSPGILLGFTVVEKLFFPRNQLLAFDRVGIRGLRDGSLQVHRDGDKNTRWNEDVYEVSGVFRHLILF
jgi:hypothetical protein